MSTQITKVQQPVRLDPESLAVKLELQQALIAYIHSHLLKQGFNPILSPKIVPFRDDELKDLIRVEVPGREDETLFMSRCPQFYKEIAALYTGNGKVYEVGPVFRGECASNGRRANEFSGLDVEVRTNTLADVTIVLTELVLGMRRDNNLVSKALAFSPRSVFPEEVIIISYGEATKMLSKDEIEATEELELSSVIKRNHPNTWILLTDFPLSSRRLFYEVKGNNLTNSFDLIGDWEICSGGMRRRDIEEYIRLLQTLTWSTKEFEPYVEIVKKNATTNTGGFGVGIERLIGAITGTTDLRQIQPYPRTPEVTISF